MSVEADDAKRERRKKIGTAWRTYKWFDRIRSWQDWYTWLASFFQTNAGVATALTATAAATTTAVLVHNVVVNPMAAPFVPVEVAPLVEPVRQTRGTMIFEIEGHDTHGRRATFDVVVAKNRYLWVRGSSDELEKDGQVISGDEVMTDVLDRQVRDGLKGAREIIAVGTASQEGNAATEVARAGRRAQSTAAFVSKALDNPSIPIWTLNLGQFRETRGRQHDRTHWQRPFMVIAVKDVADGTILSEALADAMNGQRRLPKPANYSDFELDRVGREG